MRRVQLIEPEGPVLRSAALELEPRDDELVFVGRAADMLPLAEQDPTRWPVAIIDDAGTPVGYFTLDRGARSRRYASADTIGLHGFLIDHRHRRRGLARAALLALPAYVAEHHPWAAAVALTVNTRNAPAIAAYRSAGFIDTGELFHGGEHGPQHVMRRAISQTDSGPYVG
jgi:RimJ/RimL family protein N-acetyltransferase